MYLSSPDIIFDNRLLAIEEQFRQRVFSPAIKDLAALSEDEFVSKPHELGLFHLLMAESGHFEGNYRKSIANGLRAAKVLADFPLNRRYGRVQLVLSKAYYAMGDMKNAEIRARDAVAAYRRAADADGQADSLNQLAGICYLRCDYETTAGFLEDALALMSDNPRKHAQTTGNLARTRIRTGQWVQAEEDFKTVLKQNRDQNEDTSQALNLLSRGLLELRKREFVVAQRSLDSALDIITRLDLKRERVIYLEYSGELAFERGDTFKAKAILGEAYRKGMVLASSSALVSQSGRRLAEVELALDNFDDAMKYAQKALELSLMLGEKLEVGLAESVIARVFAAREEFEPATEHARRALDVLRQVGDPYELARTLLALADLHMAVHGDHIEKVQPLIDESRRLFKKLKLEFWMAEADFKGGAFACQAGDLSGGFKRLTRAERVFSSLEAHLKVRAVSRFLKTLSEQAVALAISEENEYKAFSNLITPDEYTDLKASVRMDVFLEVVLKKTRGDRTLVYSPDYDGDPVLGSFEMSPDQQNSFASSFDKLLGEEISQTRPTLILDCRRDPFINNLFADRPDVVGSVMVVPFRSSSGTAGYLYVDRFSCDNQLRPFDQTELNLAVGLSDLIAFRWTEIQKVRLMEDNQRLKRQLMEQAAFPNIITRNPEMLDLLAQVRQVVDSNISVAIEGETGCGKDLLARAIHYNSGRRDRRFISVNCAALPESLLESELFGYKRGAFTGADRDKAGLFEEADGGTFFLDEIGDMPLSIQAKVLRILEEKEIVRLGETTPRKVDVRIISATNQDLKVLMKNKLFRQDLYYRLSAMTFRLPGLVARREDIHISSKARERLFRPRFLSTWLTTIGPAMFANWKTKSKR